MQEEHRHDCVYQKVVEAVAEAVAGRIASALPGPVATATPEAVPADLPATLSVPQAAGVIGISRGMAYEAIRIEEIPSLRIGSRIRVPTGRLFEFIATGKPWRERKAELAASLPQS